MNERKSRVLLVATHPTQYGFPVYRRLATDRRLEIQVAFCSLLGAKGGYDREFGREVKWDIPLLDGYPWVELPNHSPSPRLGWFWGMVNPSIWKLIRGGKFDAVVIFTGYRYATFWIGWLAARASGAAVLFGTDAHQLAPLDGRRWKTVVKRWLWPRLFRLADVVIVPSSASVALMRSLGIEERRIVLTPYVVDNERWKTAAARVDPAAVRARWAIPADVPVVLFSAKLQPWKRPLDLLHAFAKADVRSSVLVMVGEGPLRPEVEAAVTALGIGDRVRMLGFVNQSQLSEVYRMADVLVLPSGYEAFGVVVNEAMLCGCVPIVSDKVGARFDLIDEGKTGFVFPSGNVGALTVLLARLLTDRPRLQQMRQAARERISAWSPELCAERLVQAIETDRIFVSGERSSRYNRRRGCGTLSSRS